MTRTVKRPFPKIRGKLIYNKKSKVTHANTNPVWLVLACQCHLLALLLFETYDNELINKRELHARRL